MIIGYGINFHGSHLGTKWQIFFGMEWANSNMVQKFYDHSIQMAVHNVLMFFNV